MAASTSTMGIWRPAASPQLYEVEVGPLVDAGDHEHRGGAVE
jgi:hypothetical protein